MHNFMYNSDNIIILLRNMFFSCCSKLKNMKKKMVEYIYTTLEPVKTDIDFTLTSVNAFSLVY